MQSFFSRGRGIFLLATLLISIGAGYSLMNDQPANEEQTVTPTLDLIEPYHFSFWESYALCEEYNLGCKPVSLAMEMPAEFLQMNIENLRELYPQPAWLVLEDGKEVSITHLLDGLCAEHKKIMHLGVNPKRRIFDYLLWSCQSKQLRRSLSRQRYPAYKPHGRGAGQSFARCLRKQQL